MPAGRPKNVVENGQLAITLPKDMLKMMRERKDINWSGVAEIAFRKVLDVPCVLSNTNGQER